MVVSWLILLLTLIFKQKGLGLLSYQLVTVLLDLRLILNLKCRHL
jgi:hypothetical protein